LFRPVLITGFESTLSLTLDEKVGGLSGRSDRLYFSSPFLSLQFAPNWLGKMVSPTKWIYDEIASFSLGFGATSATICRSFHGSIVAPRRQHAIVPMPGPNYGAI
jgi:hypothetical protein